MVEWILIHVKVGQEGLMLLNNFPKQLTPFVGRSNEIEEINSLLSQIDCRLLSLIGPSGMGKTRLSLEVAHQMIHFEDGVYFVALQPLTSADTIVSAIASAIKFDSYDEDKNLQEQLLDYLSNKNILLLMDNFEHVLDGAELVAQILTIAPHIKILVTSREALKLQQEWIHQVVGMSYPDSRINVNEIDEDSAIQLFVERAQQFRRHLDIEAELPHIIRICQLVGGMPLGIELAVAWLKTLSCAEIATEIEKNNDLLTAQMRDIAERHQSIRTIFDSTWDMLTSDEQTIFMRLSIFRGTPTRQAIQTVTGAGLLTLSGLVDKALLIPTDDGRYQIHALLSQYAYEKLEASADCDSIRHAHSEYYLCFLHDRQADIYGRRQIEAVDEITIDFENIRMAWSWAVGVMNYKGIGLAVETLCTFLHFRSRWKEESYLLDDVLVHFAPMDGEEAHPVWGMVLARNYSNSQQPIEDLTQALAIARATENLNEIGLALHLMGHWYGKYQGSSDAIQYMEQSLSYFEKVDNQYHIASSYVFIAIQYRLFGDYEHSTVFNEKGLSLSRAIGNIDGQTFATAELAHTMFIIGDLQEAKRYRQEALSLAQQIGRLWNIVWLKLELGIYHILGVDGDIESCLQFIQSVESFSDHKSWTILMGLSKSLILAIDEQYDETHDFAEESTILTKHDEWFPIFAWNKLVIACGQQEDEVVHDFTSRLLHHYWERRIIPYLMLGIFFCAWLAYRTGNWRYATELLALVSTHDSSMMGWLDRWALVDRLKYDLENELGSELYKDAWNHGINLEWESVCADLISKYQNAESTQTDNSIPPHILAVNAELSEPLSARELEVLLKITQGYSNKEIADQLFVGVSTVKKHITHIYGKLQVESRTQAILRAQELTLT